MVRYDGRRQGGGGVLIGCSPWSFGHIDHASLSRRGIGGGGGNLWQVKRDVVLAEIINSAVWLWLWLSLMRTVEDAAGCASVAAGAAARLGRL